MSDLETIVTQAEIAEANAAANIQPLPNSPEDCKREMKRALSDGDTERLAVLSARLAELKRVHGDTPPEAQAPTPEERPKRKRERLSPEEVAKRIRATRAETQEQKPTMPEQKQAEAAPPAGLLAACRAASEEPKPVTFEKARDELAQAGLLPETVSDILAREPKPVDWIISDILAARGSSERGFKGDIIGGSKRRKTFFGLQLAACVSAGRDLFGFPRFHVPKPRRVLYLNFELRQDFTEERMRTIAGSFGADFGNIDILTPAKPYLLRNRYDQCGEYVEGYEDEFIAYVLGRGYELVIADPEYKLLFPEEDENSGQGVGGILRFRDRVITETRASFLFVHHDKKNGGNDLDITQRGAGSGFGGRDYDVRFALTDHAETDNDDAYEILESGSRVRPSPEDVTIIFNRSTWVFDARPEIAPERKRTKGKCPQTQQARAEQFKGEQEKMTAALAEIIGKAGRKLLPRPDVEDGLLKLGFAVGKVRSLLNLQCGDGKPYEEQAELDRGSKTGRKRRGRKFYTTHDLAREYRDKFQRLEI